jgi:hypothetical protein
VAKNRFSASSRRGDLKKSMTNIASECKSANIVRAIMRWFYPMTPKPDAIFGRDRFSIHIRGAICAWLGNCLIRPGRQQVEYQLRTLSRSAVDTRFVASPGWWALFRTETAYWPRFRSGLTFGRTTVRWKASQFSRDS